jgi:hypothetical protein
VCAFFCVCVVLCLGLRRADHPSKESYRLWMLKKLRNQPYAPKWEQKNKKKIYADPRAECYCCAVAVLSVVGLSQIISFRK